MAYTVKQLADLAGVSVRTLHHYDKIGLLSPGYVADNGYRIYEEPELVRLQQILLYREMEFSLADIKKIIAAPDYDVEVALEEHLRLLSLKRKRLGQLMKTIESTLNTMEEENTFEQAHAFAGFADDEIATFKKEVKEKYDPAVVSQSMNRIKDWNKEKMQAVQAEGLEIVQAIADAREEGASSEAVQKHIAAYHTHMNQFYDCTLEIFRGLGQMYVDDSRFTAYYEKVAPGLAAFVRDAINVYCDAA
jgi:DNA-binding transcriptional MerR regulator